MDPGIAIFFLPFVANRDDNEEGEIKIRRVIFIFDFLFLNFLLPKHLNTY